MTLEEYTAFTDTTAVYPKDRGLEYTVLGLAGEAGEVAGKYSKVIRDSGGVLTEEMRLKLIDELSDVAWFFVRVAKELGKTPEEILEHNFNKLSSRAQRGVLRGSGDNR